MAVKIPNTISNNPCQGPGTRLCLVLLCLAFFPSILSAASDADGLPPVSPFYLSAGFFIGVAVLVAFLLGILFRKKSTYNEDFVKNYTGGGSQSHEEIRLYVLLLGLVAPFTEIFLEIFKVRPQSELLVNIMLGLVCVSLYYLSAWHRFFARHLATIFTGLLFIFFLSVCYKTWFYPFNLISFSEFFLILFFSPIMLRSPLKYWSFHTFACLFIAALFFNPLMPTKTALAYCNFGLITILINYARHVSRLNAESELLFTKSIVNNGNTLVVAIDQQLNAVFLSDNVKEILGFDKSELMGKGWIIRTLGTEAERKALEAQVRDPQNEGKVYARRIRTKQGTEKWIQWQDKTFSENLIVGLGQDITEQVKAQRDYQNLIESATDVIYKTDRDGNFTYFNQYTERLIGYNISELIGKHFTTVIRPDHVKKVALYYLKNRDNTNHYETLEFPVIIKDGSEIWVSQKVSIERDSAGEITGFNSIVRDITLVKTIALEKQEKQEKTERFNFILNELTLKSYSETETLKTMLETILERASEGLKTERVSIWDYTSTRLECRYLFERETTRHSSGGILERSRFPKYFDAISKGQAIVASDITDHPDIAELREAYFPVLAIQSLLDLPILQQGELQGVVCFESVKNKRKWDTEDVNFARAIANIIAISTEAHRRKKAEKQLAYRSEILAAIARTTEQLLLSNNVSETLGECLPFLGEATRVDKVYYYEYAPSGDALHLSKQWFSKRWNAPKDTPDISVLPMHWLGDIATTLLARRYFTGRVSELEPGNLLDFLRSMNIQSTLVLPVYVKDKFYGLIGFDDCKTERLWSLDQLNIIRSLASNIANAIERVNSEKAIIESENNFRQINETIEDVFWLYDSRDEKFVYGSPSCEKVLGMSQADFYSGIRYAERHILEEDRPRLRAAEQLLQTEPYYELEYRINGPEGDIRWISEKSFAIRDDNGRSIRNSGICSDITEKKLFQSRLQQLSLVAEKTTNGILIADSEGYTLWANEGYLQMFEIPEEQLIGKRPRDLFNSDPEHFRIISQLNATNYTLEFEVITFKGNKKWVELSSTAILDDTGAVQQQVEVLTDITDKVRVNNELRQHSLDLEFQNVLKEKLINASSIRELTEEALGLIKSRMKDCIHISLLTLDEKKQNFEGYYLRGGTIEKESHPVRNIKSYEKIKNGRIFIEDNLSSGGISESDKILIAYGAVSYAVIPVLDGKEVSGMVTITFSKPCSLSGSEKNNLMNFSFILSSTIRQLHLTQSLQEKNNDIRESLDYARSIQGTILPDLNKTCSRLGKQVLVFKPKDIVSGDFYWAREDRHFTLIAIGDCTGHGVPGAFLTLIGSRLLEQVVASSESRSPSVLLKQLDGLLHHTLGQGEDDGINDGMEIALCVIDHEKKTLSFCGAGMGLLCFEGDTELYLKGEMESIGDHRDNEILLHDQLIPLRSGQRFYMASDGYQDQLGGSNFKRFSKQKLIELLKDVKDKEPEHQETLLNTAIETYRGPHPQTDDITLFGFTVK